MIDSDYTHLPTGDLQALVRLDKWGGHALVVAMAQVFTTEAPKQLLAARRATSAGESVAVERAAHSLKASSAQLGAPRVSHICERMEILAGRSTLAPIGALLDALDTELTSFAAWLNHATSIVTEMKHDQYRGRGRQPGQPTSPAGDSRGHVSTDGV